MIENKRHAADAGEKLLLRNRRSFLRAPSFNRLSDPLPRSLRGREGFGLIEFELAMDPDSAA
jgi:hypothetical protein